MLLCVDRSLKQDSSYGVIFTIKESFKHNWVQAIHGPNLDAICTPKVTELLTLHDEDSYNWLHNQHIHITPSRDYYECDQYLGLNCKNSSQNGDFQYLWRKFSLNTRSDDELLYDLKQIYSNYLYECKDSQETVEQKLDTMDNKLENKYNHPTHVKMGYPLSKACLYAIILHTDTHLHTSVITAQKEGNLAKYIVFDYCLYWAITTLNEFNKVETCGDSRKDKQITQIYSGMYVFRSCN